MFTDVINAELVWLLLLDPLQQVSPAAVLHNNTQEAIGCKHTSCSATT